MKNFWKPLKWLIPELEIVRGLILLAIEESHLPHKVLEQTARDLFDPPGKMIRPGMLLLSARSFAGAALKSERMSVPASWGAKQFVEELRKRFKSLDDLISADLNEAPLPGALPLRFYLMAAAVEMLHSATLLHDDVLDSAETRRNRPSVPSRIGNHQAILLGDQLLTMAFEIISEAASINSARLISRVVSGICRGELLQNSMLYSVEDGISLRRYRERIAGKTAAMFSLAMYLGAREMEHFTRDRHSLGEIHDPKRDDPRTDSPACRYIRRFGYATGMAFQIIDDVLDLDVSADNGKTKGTDIREGIITLPLILMLRNGTLSKEQLTALWSEPEAVEIFLQSRELSGACADAIAEADIYVRRAQRAIEAARDESGFDLDGLSLVSQLLLHRRY